MLTEKHKELDLKFTSLTAEVGKITITAQTAFDTVFSEEKKKETMDQFSKDLKISSTKEIKDAKDAIAKHWFTTSGSSEVGFATKMGTLLADPLPHKYYLPEKKVVTAITKLVGNGYSWSTFFDTSSVFSKMCDYLVEVTLSEDPLLLVQPCIKSGFRDLLDVFHGSRATPDLSESVYSAWRHLDWYTLLEPLPFLKENYLSSRCYRSPKWHSNEFGYQIRLSETKATLHNMCQKWRNGKESDTLASFQLVYLLIIKRLSILLIEYESSTIFAARTFPFPRAKEDVTKMSKAKDLLTPGTPRNVKIQLYKIQVCLLTGMYELFKFADAIYEQWEAARTSIIAASERDPKAEALRQDLLFGYCLSHNYVRLFKGAHQIIKANILSEIDLNKRYGTDEKKDNYYEFLELGSVDAKNDMSALFRLTDNDIDRRANLFLDTDKNADTFILLVTDYFQSHIKPKGTHFIRNDPHMQYDCSVITVILDFYLALNQERLSMEIKHSEVRSTVSKSLTVWKFHKLKPLEAVQTKEIRYVKKLAHRIEALRDLSTKLTSICRHDD